MYKAQKVVARAAIVSRIALRAGGDTDIDSSFRQAVPGSTRRHAAPWKQRSSFSYLSGSCSEQLDQLPQLAAVCSEIP